MRQRLSELQLAVMRVLWQRGSATVADVQAALAPERSLAYTTLATVLSRLELRGVVTRQVEGRSYVYQPAVAEEEVGHSLLGDLVEQVFSGSPSELVHQLLESQEIDRDELARIKQLVEHHERAAKSRHKGGRHAS